MSNEFYFGIGVYNIKHGMNLGTLWRSAYNFNSAFIFTVGRRYKLQHSDTIGTHRHIPLYRWNKIEDMKIPYDCQLVGIEQTNKSEDIYTFIHPPRAMYLLGAEDHGLTERALKCCHKIVSIPTKTCLNVSTAGSIIMYDRMAKVKQRNNHINNFRSHNERCRCTNYSGEIL